MLGRILVLWTLVVTASATLTPLPPNNSINDIPECGRLCIAKTVSEKSSCPLSDFNCVCADDILTAEIESCVLTECSPRDALMTTRIAKDLCGVPRRNRTLAVWLVPLLNIGISTIFYLLRIFTRVILRQGLDVGDLALGSSVALTFPVLWTTFKVADYGLGEDAWNLPPDNITHILYLYWWAEIFYQAGLPLTRISILCFYLKIFPQDRIRKAIFFLIGLNFANLIAFVIASIFQCYPIHGAWTFWDGSFDGQCNDVHLQSWIQAGVNIVFDLMVIILPLPSLARLTASRARKVQILIMFSVGFTVTIISVIRLKSLVSFANTINISYDYVEPGLYSIIEASAGIICACLPAIRALLAIYMPQLFAPTVNRSRYTASDEEAANEEAARQKSRRLNESYDSFSAPRSPIDGTMDWFANSNASLDKVYERNTELLPMRTQRSATNRGLEQDEKDIIQSF